MTTSNWLGQLSQLADHFITQRDTLLTEWRTRCQQQANFAHPDDEPGASLLNSFIHRLLHQSPEPGLLTDEPVTRPLTDWLARLHLLGTVLDEALQQFVVAHPETPTPVIAYAYRHLLQLTNEATRSQAQKQPMAARPVLVSNERAEQLHQFAHDIRATLGVLAGATALLQQTDAFDEQAVYLSIMSRNLPLLEQQLGGLMTTALPPTSA